jgi:BlaI family penicillinase repressor
MARRKDESVPDLSEAEWKVMRCLWRRSPATARDVLDGLRGETRWAYTTVKTLLARLEAKGAVSAEMRGNTSWYAPRVAQGDARRHAVRSLVERAFDGAFGSLVHHLADPKSLSKREREELRRALDEGGERRT